MPARLAQHQRHSAARAVHPATLVLATAALLSSPAVCRAQGAGGPTPQPQAVPVTPQQADEVATEWYAYHAQSTFTEQFTPGFPARYNGPQSLKNVAQGRETFDVTAYLGVRPWTGAEIWYNPEIDQGFGLGNTFGAAGYFSGEAYKTGSQDPYFLSQRLFFRQTINLGGEAAKLDPDLNQLGGTETADRIVITAGKFSVVDVFDTNIYAHDPRNDFMNWSVIDGGAFDYAANSWGFSYGTAAELYYDRFAARLGVFNLSDLPNGKNIAPRVLGQYQGIGEIEERHTLWDQPGKLKFLYWYDRGELGSYSDAVAQGAATGTTPSTGAVRSYRTKDGLALNLEQQIVTDLGFFARASFSQGSVEEDAFTDVNRSVAAGLQLKGGSWSRPQDAVGTAFVINEISHAGKVYLEHGGLGGIIGDGALVNAGSEQIFETYYSLALYRDIAHVTFDYQLVNHPAYNADRGPVSALALRLHAQF